MSEFERVRANGRASECESVSEFQRVRAQREAASGNTIVIATFLVNFSGLCRDSY